FVEVLDFQRGRATVRTRLEGWRGPDRQRIRPEFVFGPLTVLGIRHGGGFQSQHAFVELSGPLHVRDGVTTKGEVNTYQHKLNTSSPALRMYASGQHCRPRPHAARIGPPATSFLARESTRRFIPSSERAPRI